MNILKRLDADKGIAMIERILELKKDQLPASKTIKDFGGGYVECLKTKAKVVLYFGFDGSKNRVSMNFVIKKEEVLLWLEAISEKIWNTEQEDAIEFSFGESEPTEVDKSKKLSDVADNW